MEFKDYYKILGVKDDADEKTIKTAYRKLARQYHPDMNPDKGAEEKFKEVAEAYEVLKDDQRRAEFDELKKYGGRPGGGFEPPPGWQGSQRNYSQGGAHFDGDFSDFFNSMFGGSQGFQQGRQQAFRGQDVEIEMPIFLEDTLQKTVKTVAYHLQGEANKKHLKVTIPQGVSDGERIRVKGQGGAGHGQGGAAGDLYLHIRLVPHPWFDVQGHNLIITLPLAPWEAALGTKVKVPTLQGSVNVTISPNTPAGKKLRIKGKGLKDRKGVAGDLYAVVKIVMPSSSNEKTKALWQQLDAAANFDPRAEWSK
ncbi:DnaJ domain-containing protein [Dasania sp. GY-MA-18]|uniref:DnaJ domain-containing protein n=1 Tax=Dasania phycosphaerae TaxID=2950436 RepID=A0A9J6RH82_9GAMM|nr:MULTISPECIES: DnaJ C-terminal domain-containing protein [Dasania]MCR8921278.1 DnaJ domain-containing protein [Dasania sp. GY-MA-18]MCZ0863706.1 DnaJ domain-containing protein [Dasania phycosphaerae]MCZ0867434.1 DnaJ domain-containing protein [Dasania phycosphaerae]